MDSSTPSKHNNYQGGSYYCSDCLKSLCLENEEAMGTMPNSSTSKDQTQETAECASTPNERKSHLNCLLACFERGGPKKCAHCQKDTADDTIFSRFLKRITSWKFEGAVDLHAYDVPTEEEFERQNLSKNVKEFNVAMTFWNTEVGLMEYNAISGAQECLKFAECNILKFQDYLEDVPEHLRATKEYKEGAQLYKNAKDEYIETLKWI